jgi:hypothetical protein
VHSENWCEGQSSHELKEIYEAFKNIASHSWLTWSGTNVMILKNILAKNLAKKLAFLTQNKPKLCKNLITTLVY